MFPRNADNEYISFIQGLRCYFSGTLFKYAGEASIFVIEHCGFVIPSKWTKEIAGKSGWWLDGDTRYPRSFGRAVEVCTYPNATLTSIILASSVSLHAKTVYKLT